MASDAWGLPDPDDPYFLSAAWREAEWFLELVANGRCSEAEALDIIRVTDRQIDILYDLAADVDCLRRMQRYRRLVETCYFEMKGSYMISELRKRLVHAAGAEMLSFTRNVVVGALSEHEAIEKALSIARAATPTNWTDSVKWAEEVLAIVNGTEDPAKKAEAIAVALAKATLLAREDAPDVSGIEADLQRSQEELEAAQQKVVDLSNQVIKLQDIIRDLEAQLTTLTSGGPVSPHVDGVAAPDHTDGL